jgi:hypothetical protein
MGLFSEGLGLLRCLDCSVLACACLVRKSDRCVALLTATLGEVLGHGFSFFCSAELCCDVLNLSFGLSRPLDGIGTLTLSLVKSLLDLGDALQCLDGTRFCQALGLFGFCGSMSRRGMPSLGLRCASLGLGETGLCFGPKGGLVIESGLGVGHARVSLV